MLSDYVSYEHFAFVSLHEAQDII